MKTQSKQNYIYYLNEKEDTLTSISKKLNINRITLLNRVKDSKQRIYTETIMGYKFKAVRIENNIN